MAEVRRRLVKRLSATDVAESKTNQSGLLVPMTDRLGEVWTFDFDYLSLSSPSKVLAFSDADPALAWPFVAAPARASYQDPDADGLGRLPADVILEQFADTIPILRSWTLAEVKIHVEDQMPTAIDSAPDGFTRHGVGGIWPDRRT